MIRSSITLTVAAVLFTGCGQGPSSVSSLVPKAASTTKTAQAKFMIKVPHSKALPKNKARKPQYISENTLSAKITITGPKAYPTVVMDLTPQDPDCTTDILGDNLTCSIPLANLPIGSDTFAVTTYQGLNATGAVLSSGTINQTIVAGENTIPVALGGVIASLQTMMMDGSPLTIGVPGPSFGIEVLARDASNWLIFTGTAYENGPIDVTTDDNAGVITGLPVVIRTPTDGAAFGYTGGTFTNTDDRNAYNTPIITATVRGTDITSSAAIVALPAVMPPAAVFIPFQWTALNSDGSGSAIGGGATNPMVVNTVPGEIQIVANISDPIAVSANTCPASWAQYNPNQTWAYPAQNMVTFNPTAPETECQFVITDTITHVAQTVVFQD